MAYSVTNWKDHVITPARTYSVVENSDGTVTLTPAGTIVQQGTNMSAANFNNMELGIGDADLASRILNMLVRRLNDRVEVTEDDIAELNEDLLAELTPETKTVTLTNSLNYPFNNSAASVALSTTRKTKNYEIEAEITSFDGNPGELVVSNKVLNGFTIAFTGSATSVTVSIKVKGGMIA